MAIGCLTYANISRSDLAAAACQNMIADIMTKGSHKA